MADPIDPKNVIPAKVTPPISEGESKNPQEAPGNFRSYMQGGGTNPLLESGQTPQVSPFDLAGGKAPAPGPTLDTIQSQAKMAHSTMGDVANQLNTPKLKLKASTKYLLKNKLNSANAQIDAAGEKLGVPKQETEKNPAGAGPLQKFIGLVTSGQARLQAVQHQTAEIAAKGDNMNPADMLLVQMKLHKAQQQLEYSSLILSKAVDDLKMMMNIQL